jgi:hypothetical protein
MTEQVTFYWRPGCPFSVALHRGLTATWSSGG